MGVFGMFSSHKKDKPCSKVEVVYINDEPVTMANKFRYKVRNTETSDNTKYILVEVQYTDASSYEGRKILLYKKRDWEKAQKLAEMNGLDPHFLEDDSSPIARFAPTREGIRMAKELLVALGKKK
jgi:hypothetical protein